MSESHPSQREAQRLKKISDGVLDELERRLGDPAQRMEIPGTGLVKLAELSYKLQEKQVIADIQSEARPLLDVLTDAELPVERKRAIALEELGRVNEARDTLIAYLEELDGGS